MVIEEGDIREESILSIGRWVRGQGEEKEGGGVKS